MSEVAAKSGKALAWASLWGLLVGFAVENWDALAAAILSVVPAEYAGIVAGVMTLIFKLISTLFGRSAPKRLDPNY